MRASVPAIEGQRTFLSPGYFFPFLSNSRCNRVLVKLILKIDYRHGRARALRIPQLVVPAGVIGDPARAEVNRKRGIKFRRGAARRGAALSPRKSSFGYSARAAWTLCATVCARLSVDYSLHVLMRRVCKWRRDTIE